MTACVLVLGTGNRKKLAELRELLQPHGIELKSLADFPQACAVEESGASFAENAELKATVQARHLGAWVLGEDSGLCVDALGGAPGIYSARFSGPQATDQSNNRLLLEKLKGVPTERRTAYYVCHAVLSDPRGTVRARREDYCRGRILEAESGSGGFGYDPMFEVVEYHQTFGELSASVKSVVSHRARAIRALIGDLKSLLRDGRWPQ